MEEWKEYKLEEVCKSIADGDHMPPPKSDKGIPFVTISNIVDNRLDFCNTHFVPQSYYDGLDSKRRPHIGDTIYSVVGTFGKPVYVKEEKPFVFQRHIAILRPDESKIVPQFLFYSLLSPQFYRKADVMAIGAVQRTISLTSLRNATIQLPSLKIQSKIVDMLSSIDDKIEVNRRINDNLEQQAQVLFKSWFVDFEPFRNQPFVESELGMIPKSLATSFISDIPHVLETGRRPKGGVGELTRGIPSVGAEHVKGMGNYDYSKTKYITEDYASSLKTGKIKGYELLIYKDGGKPGYFIPNYSIFGEGYPYEECYLNEHVFKLDFSNKGYNAFCYFFFKTDLVMNYLNAQGGKAAIPGINRQDIENILIYSPENESVKEFGNIVLPMIKKILIRCKESRTLSQLRDTLLPRLMSGELSVDGLKGQQAVSPGPLGDDRRRFHSEAEKERPGSMEQISNTIAP